MVRQPSPDIPEEVLLKLHELQTVDMMSLQDAITSICGSRVPPGSTPCPFRRDAPESFLDKLRTIVATCKFRSALQHWKERGADFKTYLYIPETDPITEHPRDGGTDDLETFSAWCTTS